MVFDVIWISRFVGYKHGECSCLLSAHVCSSFMFTVQRACKCQSVGAFFNICFSNNTMAEAPFNNYPKLLSITVLLQVFLWFMSVLVHACFQNLFFFLNTPLGTIGRAKPGGIRSLQQNRSSHYLCRAT